MVSTRPQVLIIGAGVIGLTTAIRLAGSGLRLRVVAEHWGEETTSAAAGAMFDPSYAIHPEAQTWSDRTYRELVASIGRGVPGVRLMSGIEASPDEVGCPPWIRRLPDVLEGGPWGDLRPAVRDCRPAELPRGYRRGWRYTTPIIDMPRYLGWLRRRLEEARVEMIPQRFVELEDGFTDADIVVNCAGYGAGSLVPDPELQAVRGQLVVVRNPGWNEFFVEHADELGEMTYVVPQGEVLLLGGSAEKGEADRVPDGKVAAEIVRRCTGAFPALRDATVVGHRAGIRPWRPKVRLEHVSYGTKHVVHNYGHGGAGVSLSWGCADEVLEKVTTLVA
jgi:D-amino-acid oxidase